MICYVCDRDHFITQGFYSNTDSSKPSTPRELLICKNCGNVCYKVDPQDEIKVREYYRKEYRPAPNETNLLTTTNKQNYIVRFLFDFLKDKKGLVVGDVGCATGYMPFWFRNNGHKATGSEWTVTYRRFAEHYYGIPISEELETKHKYDLIIMYHTLEHMIEPDKKLMRYRDMLKDDGHMLVSTPEWFNVLEEAGGSNIKSFEHLFHPDHINVFSPMSLKNLFRKAGFEIIKEDHIVYGQTYLIKVAKTSDIIKENPKEREDQIERAKQAIALHTTSRHKDAANVWPKFPEAYIAQVEAVHYKDPIRQADIFEQAKQHLSDNIRLRNSLGLWFYKQQRYTDALKVFTENCQQKPVAHLYYYIALCLFGMSKYKEAQDNFQLAMQLDPSNWIEYVRWVCKCASAQPTWDERATQAFQQHVINQNKQHMKLENPDPVMNGKNEGVKDEDNKQVAVQTQKS